MVAIAMIKASDEYYIMAHANQASIQAFPTIEVGLKHFEDAYNESHDRSYEGSMSACINNMSFQPSIVGVPRGLDELAEIVGSKEAGYIKLGNVSGSMYAVKAPAKGEEYWEKGHKPHLITEKANPA